MVHSVTRSKNLLAVCGKGGGGKTAFTAMMSRVLVESGRAGRLLVIDADPAMGLLTALGIRVKRTMGQVRERIIKTARDGEQQEKDRLVDSLDYMAFEAMEELDSFALLAMGRTETLGCYCPVNDLLRGAIETLSKSFDTILIDGEAGLEQINRQVVRRLSTLIIVSDATARGIETAEMIKNMVERDKVVKCQRLGLVFNRVSGNEDLLKSSAQKIGLELFGIIPQDANIAYYDLVSKPITELPSDSPGLAAVREIAGSAIGIAY
ncbi:MAG: carbon monoxide dehydrogenase maturation protein [Chloroflexi bacterium]|nr:carbon monoxide dehydrogenase maturation protein [Chloroflexota bacterium]